MHNAAIISNTGLLNPGYDLHVIFLTSTLWFHRQYSSYSSCPEIGIPLLEGWGFPTQTYLGVCVDRQARKDWTGRTGQEGDHKPKLERGSPSPVDRIADTSENITFPRLQLVIIKKRPAALLVYLQFNFFHFDFWSSMLGHLCGIVFH